MPYIKKDDAYRVNQNHPENVGELNYAITTEVIRYLKRQPKFNYETLNGIYGAMQLAAAEFKRRLIDPYEDGKIGENGDVYPPELLAKAHKGSRPDAVPYTEREIIGYDAYGLPIRRSAS